MAFYGKRKGDCEQEKKQQGILVPKEEANYLLHNTLFI